MLRLVIGQDCCGRRQVQSRLGDEIYEFMGSWTDEDFGGIKACINVSCIFMST